MTELDITKYLSENPSDKVEPARFSDDFQYIIDSDGNKVELDDPRIVHVNPSKTRCQHTVHFFGKG